MRKTSLPFLLATFLAFSGTTGCGPMGGDDSEDFGIVSNTTEIDDYAVGIGSLGNISIAQSFTLSASATVSTVSVKLFRQGSFPAGNGYSLTVTLESNSSNAPGGVVSGTSSATVAVTQITSTTSTYYTFTLAAAQTLAAGTYWIKLTADYPTSSTNFIKSGASDVQDYYPGGHAAYLNASSAWATTSIGGLRDLVFILR